MHSKNFEKINIKFKITGLSMMHGQLPAPELSPAEIKEREAWAGNEKPAPKKAVWADCLSKVPNSSSRIHFN